MILILKKEQQEALDYLYQQLKEDELRIKRKRNTKEAFRHSAEGRFNHTMTVLYHAREILGKVVCSKEVVEMAVILHDIAKIADDANHEETGAVIAKGYLEQKGYGQAFTRQVIECIRLHNRKGETPTASIEAKVVQDADLLDKRVLHEMQHLQNKRLKEEERKKAYKRILKAYKKDLKDYADRANFPFVRLQILDVIDRMEKEIYQNKVKCQMI
ncbi:putative nucleotidyltransferase with HDIG domain [Anaerosolibacter carboniphilus]|uniref:Putative nucleotidyltransferase with HDIG domain n=1 Tax=Anaerosolibacter carboniphilus TaxID=1417629 RepID=A0A841KRG1_9FIRM|nr:HD domain-containing protein [Anaerosolibacter carboniphilus]MBB6214728.1 putative nucleotidyltransferase with HDIG domain [Anaerosolibacter carboniphilus]